mgnify:CR=1 FL=1
MTSTVTFTAHCPSDTRLYVCRTHVDHTGTQRKTEDWLKDGETLTDHVHDSKRAHAFEVDASMVPADYVPHPQIVQAVPPPVANVTAPADTVSSGGTWESVTESASKPGADAPAETPATGGEFGGAGASGSFDPAPGFDADSVNSSTGD